MVIAAALCFSTSGTVQALAPEGATPYVIGAIRALGGGLLLLIWCLWRGYKFNFVSWPKKLFIGASLGVMSSQLFFFKGVLDAGVAVGTVVCLGTMPIFTALLAWLILKEKPVWAWYPATALAAVGLVLLNWSGASHIKPQTLIFPLLASLVYGIYLVFSKPLVTGRQPEVVMSMLCLMGGLILAPIFFIFPVSWLATPHGFMVGFYMALITSAVAFSLNLAGLKRMPASTASTLGLAEPLNASLLGIFFLNEPMDAYTVCALLCIFCAAAMLIYFSSRVAR